MTAIQVLAEVRVAGGSLTAMADGLRVRMPAEPPPRLLEAIRQRKPDLLVLLRYPATACPACEGYRFWRDGVGVWRCDRCDPDSPADPFGPLPVGEEAALAELELRAKLREPEYARLLVPGPDGPCTLRSYQIRAAAVVWAASGPESIARRHAAAWDGIPEKLVAGRPIGFIPGAGTPAPGEWARTPRGAAVEVLAYDATSGEVLVRPLADPPRWAWFAPSALVSEMDWRPA